MATKGPKGQHHDLGQRIQALALAEYGVHHPESKITKGIVAAIAGVSPQSISVYMRKAVERVKL